MSTYTQESRHIAIATPLGEDVLLLNSLSGEEGVSTLFHFDLDLLSEEDSIDPTKIVGKNVTILLRDHSHSEGEQNEPRYFNGYVSRFAYWGRDDRMSRYRAQIVPWLWFLTRRTDSRIFQEKSVNEIVSAVFDDLGFKDYEFRLQHTYEKREYCVQYQESDLDFVSRLLEDEGIYYYFDHFDGRHLMVISDHKGGYEECADKSVEFKSTISGKQQTDQLRSWEHVYQYTSGGVAQKDFNFKEPADSLLTGTQSLIKLENNNKFELYEYPAGFETDTVGKELAKRRMEAEENVFDVVLGTSVCPMFTPGHTFEITHHHHASEEGKTYVLSTVKHEADATGVYETGGGKDDSVAYTNSFTCIPADKVFRPERKTPRPHIPGAQTAIVVGPSGEEIYTDEFGRVKLQFHWDRYGKADDTSSCWIRVSHGWAGNRWGAMFLPRIGQEVVVTFLDGDPDRPLITGSVYNGKNDPPYRLPDFKTMSGFKSRSTKDADDDSFNEIRFEDKKGDEQIFIQAQRNLDVRVENDRFESIEHDRHLVVENDKHEHIKNDRHETVDRHHHELIGDERHLHVKGKEAKEVDGSQSLIVKGDVGEEFKSDHSLSVTGDSYIKANQIVLEADSNITIKVGSSFIAIESGGITIETPGKLEQKGTGGVDIESSAQVNMSGDAGVSIDTPAMAELKGSITKVNGDGMVEVRGGVVKIN